MSLLKQHKTQIETQVYKFIARGSSIGISPGNVWTLTHSNAMQVLITTCVHMYNGLDELYLCLIFYYQIYNVLCPHICYHQYVVHTHFSGIMVPTTRELSNLTQTSARAGGFGFVLFNNTWPS